MKTFHFAILTTTIAAAPLIGAHAAGKNLYQDAVAPILSAKCVGCHGESKQKGKLRVDSIAEMIKGGSDGPSLVPGKPEDSLLMKRIHLPLSEDEHMPPQDKDQLSADEIAVLKFWIQSGATADASIDALNAPADVAKAITAVLAAAPASPGKKADAPKAAPALSDSDKKLIADTMKEVKGSLMSIAQDTPQLEFNSLNVAKEFGNDDLKPLEKVGPHLLWLKLGRTQVTDEGLALLDKTPNLTRLHLENTKVTDAGLDHVKNLANLEYLNLYGTGITDAGIAKLAGNKNLKKLYLWQTQVTDKGVESLAKAVPGIDINTGWKEPVIAAVAPPAAQPAAPVAPAKPETKPAAAPAPAPAAPATTPAAAPAKPEVKPAAAPVPAPATTPAPTAPATTPVAAPAKPEVKPAAAPVPAPATTPAAAPAPAPSAAAPATPAASNPQAAAPAPGSLESALVELAAAREKAKKDCASAKAAHEMAIKKAEEASRAAAAMKAALDKALEIESKTEAALQELTKAVEASRKK